MRLNADAEHEIPLNTETGAIKKLVVGPMNFPDFTFREAHHRALPVEVVKLFRINGSELLRHQLIAEITNRRRRRGTGVTPAGKGKKQHRIAQRRAAPVNKRIDSHN